MCAKKSTIFLLEGRLDKTPSPPPCQLRLRAKWIRNTHTIHCIGAEHRPVACVGCGAGGPRRGGDDPRGGRAADTPVGGLRAPMSWGAESIHRRTQLLGGQGGGGKGGDTRRRDRGNSGLGSHAQIDAE